MDIRFSPFGSNWFIPLIIVALLSALIIWGVWGNTRLSRGKKIALLALRFGVIAALFWILIRPSTVVTIKDKEAASVAILVDSSRSMGIVDCQPKSEPPRSPSSRYAAAVDTLKKSESSLKQLNQSVDLKSFAFDKDLYPVRLFDLGSGNTVLKQPVSEPLPNSSNSSNSSSSSNLSNSSNRSGSPESPDNGDRNVESLPGQPRGELTALGHSLEELLRQEAGKRLLGVVVLSDGSQKVPYSLQNGDYQTAPQSAAAQYQRLGIPLYTVVYGQSEEQKTDPDASIDDINTPSLVFLRNSLTVRGQIRIDNLQGQAIPVRLLFETQPGKLETVAETTVSAETAAETVPVELSYAPTEVGEFKVRLEIAPPQADTKPQNNLADTFIRVVDGGLNVLYLEGAIRPEQKFISRAFEDSPNGRIDVVRLNYRKAADQTEIQNLIQDKQYDVIILGDVHSTLLSTSNWELLVKRVESGTGLFLLGGFNSYGPGGFAESPLASVIPVRMDRLERQNPDDAPASDLHIDQYVKVVPTAAGANHPSLQITTAGTTRAALADAWSALPALEGANRWQEVRPGASILAVASVSRKSPILVSSRYDKGLVLAFAGDSTWRWPLAGFSDEHKRFWLQSIFWLGQKKQTIQGALALSVDLRRVAAGTPVLFNAEALTSDGKPVAPSDLELIVTNPSGQSVRVGLHSEKGKLTGRFEQTNQPGDYSFNVKAYKNGELFGQTQGRFQSVIEDLELDRPAADPGTLQQIAAASGGKRIQPDELSDLLTSFQKLADHLEITRQVTRTLWDSFWLLFLIIALLTTEWSLRKRWGEV